MEKDKQFDAAQAIPAAGKKKYVPPRMRVIPLGPQRLLAASGPLPSFDICAGRTYDSLVIYARDFASASDFADEVRSKLSRESLMSDPAGVASWANSQSWSPSSPFNYPVYGLPGAPTLGEFLQSAVITNAVSSPSVGQYYVPGRLTHYLDWGVKLVGYVPGQYSFTVNGSYGDTECFIDGACYGYL